MVRRFLLASVFCLVLLLGLTSGIAQAQESPNKDSPYGPKVSDEEITAYTQSIQDCSSPSLECLVRNTTRFVWIEMTNEIIGPTNSASTGQPLQNVDGSRLSPIAQRSGGAIGGLYKMIGGMYAYPPANSARYVADVLDNAGFVSPAYAQGLGFASLDPILSLWKTFRNVAYFFFIAIIIVIGIMIMLRQKISAQASISAQQALPSIIVSLILVTFSYAIAGLLIDAMYISMYLIVGLFDIVSTSTTPDLGTRMIGMNIFNLAGFLFKAGVLDAFQTNANMITQIISSMVNKDGTSSAVTGFLGFMGGLTVTIIVAVAILIGTIKLFFELLKSYASIIMGVVFSPLYLMMGAIPGQNAFGPWIKNLIGNLAAFPTVLLFIIILKIFTENLSNDGAGGFMPPFLIGSGQSGIAGYVIGLAILLALPEIVKEIKKKLGASEGGFGWMVASAAANRGKEAWNKGAFGVSAKGITRGLGGWVAAPAAGALIGGGGGAIVGGIRGARRGTGIMAGMREGAKFGAAGGALVGALPVAVPDTVRLAGRAAKTIGNVSKVAVNVAAGWPLITEAHDKFMNSSNKISGAVAAAQSITKGKGKKISGGTSLP